MMFTGSRQLANKPIFSFVLLDSDYKVEGMPEILNFDNIPGAGGRDDEFGWLREYQRKESGDRSAVEFANTSLEDLDVEENKEFPDFNNKEIFNELKELEK